MTNDIAILIDIGLDHARLLRQHGQLIAAQLVESQVQHSRSEIAKAQAQPTAKPGRRARRTAEAQPAAEPQP
jgi:hypothetical protein